MHTFASVLKRIILNNKEKEIALSLVTKILGRPKDNRSDTEYEFNCITPVCRNDENKFNLGLNLETNVFHCWKCTKK